MTSDENLLQNEFDDGSTIDDLFSEYVDRLNSGEILDHEEMRIRHPQVAEDLFERLEAFEKPLSRGTPSAWEANGVSHDDPV